MAFNDLRIPAKLGLVFLGVIGMIVLMGATIVLFNLRFEASVARTEQANKVIVASDAVRFRLTRQENSLRGLLLSGDDYYRGRLETHRAKYQENVAALQTLLAGHEEDLRMVAAMQTAFKAWTDGAIQPAVALAADPATRPQAAAMVANDGVADKLIAPVEDAADAVRAKAEARLAAEARTQAKIAAWLRISVLGGLATVAATALIAGLLLRNSIARPVVVMAAAMRRLAAGDNAVDVPAVGRRDEIGEMADAVQTFKNNALAKLSLEAEAAEARDQADRARDQTDEERRRNEAVQTMVVDTLAERLARLADGDLTGRIEADFVGRYARLKDDFNAAMAKLQETMGVIAGASTGVRASAEEIANASDSLSRRTEQQAASLEETAAALDEITATVRKTASGAKEASSLVAQARGGAEQSGAVVRQAVEAMSQIEASSREISQIIGVIDEIAFQTNLLALNAGVEAARAGDAGKGFAVVASEVRALAQRSAEAAKEIKALINTSTQQVGSGVSLVGQTGEALQSIVAQVVDIDGLVAEIAASATEQSTGLAEVNNAINQMDQVVQQNAAMVEEATAATHSLQAESAELKRMVSRFKVGEAAVMRPAARAPAMRPGGGLATALRTTTQTAPAAEEWEEF